MGVKALALSAAVLAASLGGQASATTYVVTWTGTIFDGYDTSGRFGSIGDLTGQTVSVAFRVNPDIGTITTHPGNGSSIDFVYPNYAVTSSVTINGITVDILPTYESTTSEGNNAPGSGTDDLYQEVRNIVDTDVFDSLGNYLGYREIDNHALALLSATGNFLDADIRTPVSSYTLAPSDFSWGLFNFSDTFYQGPVGLEAPGPADYAYGFFTPTFISVTSAPEPGAWGLMIVGFACVGAALRRRAASEGWA